MNKLLLIVILAMIPAGLVMIVFGHSKRALTAGLALAVAGLMLLIYWLYGISDLMPG